MPSWPKNQEQSIAVAGELVPFFVVEDVWE
jgi:hypothetical protein